MTPSLCGSFLVDKRSLVAFTWTITTVLTFVAFLVSFGMILHVHSHYMWMEKMYVQDYQSNNNNDEGHNRYLQEGAEGGQGEQQQAGSGDNKHSADKQENEQEMEAFALTMSSGSVTFVAVYTIIIAIGLSMYGTTAIVGFTSLRGDYIAPCFSSSGSSTFKLGIFGGAIVLFANVLLVCAVFFGEVTVSNLTYKSRQ